METVGPEKAKEIKEAVALDKMAKCPEAGSAPVATPVKPGIGNDFYNDPVKCWESLSGTYFIASRNMLEKAINGVNKQLLSDFRVTENDLFDYLGIDHNRNGDLLGWDTESTLAINTFYASKLDDEGMPCLVLDYATPPKWLDY